MTRDHKGQRSVSVSRPSLLGLFPLSSLLLGLGSTGCLEIFPVTQAKCFFFLLANDPIIGFQFHLRILTTVKIKTAGGYYFD